MRPHGRHARVDAANPEALVQCDRCGQWYNRTDLVWQDVWAGTHLYNTGLLVCRRVCYDVPNEQLRTIILPPDPPPVLNARVPNFAYEEQTPRIIQFADPLTTSQKTPWGVGRNLIRATQDGELVRVLQYITSIGQ